MRVFKTKSFKRFMRSTDLTAKKLAKAVQEIESGLNDGELGGGLVKKRMAREGKGKRGGYRTIIAYVKGTKAFFIYGYPKNVKDNLEDDELEQLKKLAKIYIELTDAELAEAIKEHELEEIDYDEEVQE